MLDVILGGGSGGDGKDHHHKPDVRSINPKVPKDNSPEAKAARAFFSILNTLDFEPTTFGLAFYQYKPVIQMRALECLIEIIDVACYRLDNGFCTTPEDVEFCLAAKRAQEAMEVFRELGMLPIRE